MKDVQELDSQPMRLKNSVAYQLLKIVFAIYLIISVSITGFHMTMEYRNARDLIITELLHLQKAFEDGLSTSLYELNRDQLTSIVHGMYNVPALVGIKIEASNQDISIISIALGTIVTKDGGYAEVDKQGKSIPASSSNLIEHSFPIYAPESELEIAQGTIYSSEEIVFSNVKAGFIRIIISAIIKTIALWFLFLWAASGRLTRPLRTFTSYIAKLSPNNPDYLSLHPTDEELELKNHQNEIGLLARTFEKMRAEILQKIKNMHALEDVIKTQNRTLEEKIDERTHELSIAKDKAENANRSKSVFLTNMSHELRTPLNSVLGFSELMTRDPQTSQKQHENLSIIRRSGEHLLAMINNVLDMSKIEAGKTKLEKKPVDLHLFLQELGDIFGLRAHNKHLEFQLQLQPELPRHVSLDVGKLRQVLINLLGNAIKFTETGNITLRTRTVSSPNGNWQLLFEVEDTGSGISAEELKTIFEPFAQASHSQDKYEGTGLGLAICRQFIELMGSNISVESTLGKGSIFRFEILVTEVDASNIEDQVTSSQQRIVGLAKGEPAWRILIAEDKADNRLLLSQQLESVGFEVREAVNGKEAIQQFKDWQPHLIWMDLRMPVMDGYEATRHIRELPGGKEVKILALTASVFKEQEKDILTAGCDAVLHKPYNEAKIFTAMAEQLGLHYVYEEPSDTKTEQTLSKLCLEDLQGLPKKWLDELLTTARLGDTETMLSLTDTLDAKHAETKAKLRYCINEFELQFLSKLLEESVKED